MRNTAVPVLLATLALLAGGAGCSEDPDDDPDAAVASAPATSTTPSTGAPTATRTAIPDASAPPFARDIRTADGGAGSGNGLGLTGVRTARHLGYDRVVFDLGGTGTPGWRVEYASNPTYDGSGEPVTLQGTVFLSVVLRGMGLPYDTGIAPFGSDTTRLPGNGTKGVAEIAPGGVFEGEQQAFIGLTDAKRPFRVFALAHPTRVVVDVRDR